MRECPQAHQWFELERAAASRDEAERLRRHLAQCPECRAQADDIRAVAASLEQYAGQSRMDLSAEAEESLRRRIRVHGLLGRPQRAALALHRPQVAWIRRAFPVAAAVAAVVMVAVGIRLWKPTLPDTHPRGALERLAQSTRNISKAEELRPLAALARAAVSEEFSRTRPSLDQVADLALVSYITERPRENRQVSDVHFLVAGVLARRQPEVPRAARTAAGWPMLGWVALAQASRGAGSPLATAQKYILAGDYARALAALPADDSAAVLRAWCLRAQGKTAAAADVLAQSSVRDGDLARVLRADLALGCQDADEAMRQYGALALKSDRYWFAAGYVCLYERQDMRGAGLRFQRVRDPRLASHVARRFPEELAAAGEPEPRRFYAEDFQGHPLGPPQGWALVQTRGGEFRVVDVPQGKALRQEEINRRGAEFLCGAPDWANYTLQFDVKVLAAEADYGIGAAAYRRADGAGYVLQLAQERLRILKQPAVGAGGAGGAVGAPVYESMEAEVDLPESILPNWWYTMKIRIQHTDIGVRVTGKVWRSDTPEPFGWNVVWTDTGQAGVGPLAGGAAGVRIDGARVLLDNISVTQNEAWQRALVP